MSHDLQPKQLAEVAGISPSHASNILSGTRGASTEIALAAFRAFGVRLGPLAELTDADIAKLASQQGAVAECHGCDAAASAGDGRAVDHGSVESCFDHEAEAAAREAALSTGQSGEMSCLLRQAQDDRGLVA